MIPDLKQGNPPKDAEELLENITDSIQKLELNITAMARMYFDDGLPSNEFNALMCSLHLQVHEISKQISNFKP